MSSESTQPPLSPIAEETLPPLVEDTNEVNNEENNEENKEVTKEEEKTKYVSVPVIDFDKYFHDIPKRDTNKEDEKVEETIKNLFSVLEKEPETYMISFPTSLTCVPQNVSHFMKNKDGKLYFEIPLNRNCDVATDFKVDNENVKMEMVILNDTIDCVSDTKVILVSCVFNTVIFRFTFVEEPVEFTFSYKSYIAQHHIRKEIVSTPALSSQSLLYKEGIVQLAQFENVENVENVKEENKEESKEESNEESNE